MINRLADFFQNLFGPVVNVLGGALLYFHQTLGVPWWLSIVMLTVIVRSLLFPLTVKQVRSMRAMQDLKPAMDKVRAQFRDNPQRQREEMAKVYEERGVNPLGGCLPILVQMPIFIGIFYVIRKFGGTPGRTAPQYDSFTDGGILWFHDLSHADPYYVLPVISALTMLAATEITSKNVDPQQRWLMRLLPVGFTAFLLHFPAGLFMYWITSNLVTLVQNYVIYNRGSGKKSAGAKKNAGSGKTGANGARQGSQGSDGGQASTNGTEDDAVRAAKIAKRKRRKKKK
ncbi:MAG: membrane protein insertase YidC [Rubrobacteraceae bacterium]|nr:membrane protein insertase YidC [Rubrobacteraceae bacterium]